MSGPEDPELAQLAADSPGWEVWRRKEDGLYVAWLVLSQPPVVLYAESLIGLREQVEHHETGSGDGS